MHLKLKHYKCGVFFFYAQKPHSGYGKIMHSSKEGYPKCLRKAKSILVLKLYLLPGACFHQRIKKAICSEVKTLCWMSPQTLLSASGSQNISILGSAFPVTPRNLGGGCGQDFCGHLVPHGSLCF